MKKLEKLSREQMSSVLGGVVDCQSWYTYCIIGCPTGTDSDPSAGIICHAECNNAIKNHEAPCAYPQ
jgi:hypothetical protein